MTDQCEHGSLARICPLCEANADALRTDINSEFNACMFRDRCRSMEAEIAAMRAEVERLRAAPTTEAAAAMGACGAEAAGVPHDDNERLAFEAWVKSHCWAICAKWENGGYIAPGESISNLRHDAVVFRMLWAAWRDRAALAKITATSEVAALRAEVEKLRGHLQNSINAEISGYMVLLKNLGTHWEIGIPNVMVEKVRIPQWPCDAEALRTYMPTSTPAWFITRAMKLAERWREAFSDGGAA